MIRASLESGRRHGPAAAQTHGFCRGRQSPLVSWEVGRLVGGDGVGHQQCPHSSSLMAAVKSQHRALQTGLWPAAAGPQGAFRGWSDPAPLGRTPALTQGPQGLRGRASGHPSYCCGHHRPDSLDSLKDPADHRRGPPVPVSTQSTGTRRGMFRCSDPGSGGRTGPML